MNTQPLTKCLEDYERRQAKWFPKAKRYFIADKDGIPYRSQPENGYTKLQVIAAVHRYATEDAKLFGGSYTDYIHDYTILDDQFHEATELYTAL